ncbi:MAG: zinc-binding dehydrogenase [Nitrososphaerota archaeon]|nr:zinc-binding dehydrogenase [Nitrososphaerota archaeon]
MRAALLHENESTLKLGIVDTPRIAQGEALVQVQAAGLCRTDLKFIRGLMKPRSYPHILGHEISGKVIEAMPADIRDEESLTVLEKTNYKALVYFYLTCGGCFYCLSGKSNLCTKLARPGFELPGGFCEYVKVPIRNLVATSLDADAAVLTDAGATMLQAIRKVAPKSGTRIAFAGAGGLGTFGIQLAKQMGCEVVALDVDEKKLQFARSLGADGTLNVTDADPTKVREILDEKGGGRPVDIFVDLVGNESTQSLAIALLAKGGKLIQVGWTPTSFSQVTLKKLVYDELQIIGSVASFIEDLRDFVELAELGKIKLNVTKRYPLEEINSAIEELEQNKVIGRSIVVP